MGIFYCFIYDNILFVNMLKLRGKKCNKKNCTLDLALIIWIIIFITLINFQQFS